MNDRWTKIPVRVKVGAVQARRRGATAALVVVSIAVLVGMASLTVDVGMMYRARAEAQASADAAAMAAAWRLMDNDRLTGNGDMSEEIALARATAAEYAGRNEVVNTNPSVDVNSDVYVGQMAEPWDPNEEMTYGDTDRYNAVRVLVRRDSVRNGPVEFFFAGVFGHVSADISAEAYAAFRNDIAGFRPTNQTGNADVLPLALHVNAWNNLLAGTFTTGDNFRYNEATGQVTAGSDGIRELNLYPGGGSGQLPPGNFGTVDIGGANNSTSDLSRQIRYGISPDDIQELGFDLVLGPSGSFQLNGDTGLSAGIKDDLAAIKGLPRTIPLFSSVTGPGNNAMYTIVGFAGVRIMDVKLTGSMSSKKVIIQPAYVIDDSAVAGGPGLQPGQGDFVYRPVELVR